MFPGMFRLRPIRLVLATLLVLFSAPVVAFADAVVFHGGDVRPVAPAVGAADASFGHGDACQLASHQGHATPEASVGPSAQSACDTDRPSTVPESAPPTARTTLPPSRAPPQA